MDGRWMRVGGAVMAMVVGTASARAALPVVLYDDFSNVATSNTLWSKDVAGAGTVTFGGGQVVLDMSSPTTGKSARISSTKTFLMANSGGSFRVTWDQQFTQDNINAFGTGLSVFSSGNNVYNAVQVGRQNDGNNASPYLPHHFTVYNGLGVGPYGVVDGGTVKHHFDVTCDGTTATFAIYAYNVAFDATPDAYLTSGTLLETLSTSVATFNLNGPLTVMFADESYAGTDSFAQSRGVVAIDNVFVSVPEAGSLGMLAVGAGVLGGRRRRRGK